MNISNHPKKNKELIRKYIEKNGLPKYQRDRAKFKRSVGRSFFTKMGIPARIRKLQTLPNAVKVFARMEGHI